MFQGGFLSYCEVCIETFQKNEFSGPAQAQIADDMGMNMFGGLCKLGRRLSFHSCKSHLQSCLKSTTDSLQNVKYQ